MEGKNRKNFDEMFKKLFPDAYRRRMGIPQDDKMGLYDFMNKAQQSYEQSSNKDPYENQFGEPDEVESYNTPDGWQVTRKTWYTKDKGKITKESCQKMDTGSKSSEEQNQNDDQNFHKILGFMFGNPINPNLGMSTDFLNSLMKNEDEMDDDEIEEQNRIFNEIFGPTPMGGNHFDFDRGFVSSQPPNQGPIFDKETLKKMEEEAVNNEDYKTAAEIRDALRKMDGNNSSSSSSD